MTQLIKYSRQLLVVISASALLSCNNYYKVLRAKTDNNNETAAVVDSLNKAGRTLILRNGDQAYAMNGIAINSDKTLFECTLSQLTDKNKLHLKNGINGKMRYKKNKSTHKPVLNEAHVYATPDLNTSTGTVSIAMDKVKRVEIIIKDKKRTSDSYVAGGLGILVGLAAITYASLAIALSNMQLLGN
ncbi:MAG: hypothetical protein QM791_20450 [Ferruginibacter sp.]